MPALKGQVGVEGPLIEMKVMQSPQLVAELKKAGLNFAAPCIINALIGTDASSLAIDTTILQSLGIKPTGTVKVHTPSTQGDGEEMCQYDIHVVIGEGQSYPLTMVLPAIGVAIANQGFCALIGREILNHCVLTYDGPKQKFYIDY